MSANLRVRQVGTRLRELFEEYLDLEDISEHDAERDQKILTRCLAAFAVAKVTGCSNPEAAAAVWDGSDDNGIDAAFFDENNNIVVVAQSKWIQAGAGEPSADEVGTFINGVEDLIENRIDNFAERLKGRVETIGDALMRPGTTVQIELISTGSSALAKHAMRNVDRLLDSLNGEGSEEENIASFECSGLSGVFDSVTDVGSLGKVDVEATFQNWSKISEPHESYFGIIDGYQLKTWWQTHGKRIVAKNIRHSLGPTDVNIGISDTASDEPENFWFFNNGVTLIAEEITKSPALASSRATGNFFLKSVSIVNGAQTVSTLSRVENDESLGQAQVPVRVISLKEAPAGFGERVTKTNNTYNRIEGRDFVSEDPEQARIKKEMELEGVLYEYHRGADFCPSNASCELIEATTALACSSSDPSYFIAVKTGVGRFFYDLSKAPYKALFNPETSGPKVFNAVRFLRECDRWIDEKKKAIERRSGYQWGVLVHGNRAITAIAFQKYGVDRLEAEIKLFGEDLSKEVDDICEQAYADLLAMLERDYPKKFLAVLFKRPVLGKEIFEFIEIS